MLIKRFYLLSLVFTFLSVFSAHLNADTLYYASANYQGGSNEVEIVSVDPVTLVHSPPYSNADVMWRVDSWANQGSVGAMSLSTNIRANLGTSSSTSSRVRFETDDLVFSSANSDPITTSLNLTIYGEEILARCCAATFARNEFTIRMGIGSHEFGGSYSRQINNDGSYSEGRGQMLVGLPSEMFYDNLTTPEFTVAANTSLDFWIEVETENTTSYRAYSNAIANVLLRLPKGIDVFNDLPQGVSVNSDAALIFDNRFRGSAIPEPTTTGLIGAVLICGLCFRHRRPHAHITKSIQK